MTCAPLLELAGAGAAYGESTVLWDVDLSVAPRAVTAVIGRNGVGKTTLMAAIMGILPLSSGVLHFDGKDLTAAPPQVRARSGIAIVPQGRHIFPQLTVRENLETGLSALGDRGRQGDGVPSYIYDLFPKLGEVADRKGGFLSGGEQQQLAIGRALAGQPKLLLLDEPTEGIQPSIVQQIEAALKRVRDEMGLTVIIVEQYLDFVWRFADRFAAMQEGRIVMTGATAEHSLSDVSRFVKI